jgi:3-hydroxyisobutyrate dehydrogenase-like beta-hydroxyacid dehydrogenase
MKLGFVGLGKMGWPMTVNLLKAGHDLVVYNRSVAPRERAKEAGAVVVESPRAVAEASDIVFTCIATPPAVEEVCLGDGGLWDGARAGQLFVDLSTISPSLARTLAERFEKKEAQLLDAPISGGPAGAEAGTLAIMAGGDTGAYSRVEPVLRDMGEKLFHCGPVGSGSTVKLLNQLLVGINTMGVVEMGLASKRSGVDQELIRQVITASTGYSKLFESRFGKVAHRDFSTVFSVDLLAKDLRLALEMTRELGLDLPLASRALAVFEQASREGLGSLDTIAVIQLLDSPHGEQRAA